MPETSVLGTGYGWVIDLDLEKFFDRVDHDKLMGQIAKRVEDKRLRKQAWKELRKEVRFSPLLSNLVLDELDRELERRGHRYVRYADDCNIYVRSQRAGQRVMEASRASSHTNSSSK